MDQATGYAAAMAISSAAAALVKWLSKRQERVLHQWAAPVVGAVAAGAADALLRQELDLNTVMAGSGAMGTAALIHQLVWKGWLRSRVVKEQTP